VRMAPGKEAFSVLGFIWEEIIVFHVRKQELSVCPLDLQDDLWGDRSWYSHW
jgi:hypothetical protein